MFLLIASNMILKSSSQELKRGKITFNLEQNILNPI